MNTKEHEFFKFFRVLSWFFRGLILVFVQNRCGVSNKLKSVVLWRWLNRPGSR